MYAVTIMQQLQSNSVLLGLPFDRKQLALKVYVGYERKVLEMTVCTLSRSVEDDLKRLFCTLYGCVHALIRSPFCSKQQAEITIKCCSGEHSSLSMKPPKGEGYTHLYAGPRVILCKQKMVVSKYYDATFHAALKLDVNLKYLPQATSYRLNHQVTVLQYPYLSGSHTPQSPKQVAAIMLNLQNLHTVMAWCTVI